jgi:hypothetical protein
MGYRGGRKDPDPGERSLGQLFGPATAKSNAPQFARQVRRDYRLPVSHE